MNHSDIFAFIVFIGAMLLGFAFLILTRIENRTDQLDRRIMKLEARLDSRIDRVGARIDRRAS